MQYQVTRGEKGKVEVKVDLTKAEFTSTYNQILSQYAKEAKISGFRPGRAPADVVERYAGLSKLLNETASFLMSKHLDEIFKKEDLIPVDSPKIAIESLSRDTPFSFVATFSLKPKVTVGDWKKLKIKRIKPRQITGEDVEASVKSIFEAYQKQKGAESQRAKETKSEDESPSKKFIYDAHGNKIFLKDETEKSKEPKETKTKIDDEPFDKAQDKPDDEFAKAIGARDLAHLREIVRGDLKTVVNNQVEAKFEEEIVEKISEVGKVEVPDVLVEDELNRVLIRLSNQLEEQRRTLDDYLKEQKTTVEELKNKWRDQAAKNVKITLFLDEIGKQEKVAVTKEEVEGALKSVAKTDISEQQKSDLERYIAVSIFQAKTLDLVKKTVAS
ncbi:hypothetical protein HYW39_00690 [Candidatus Curtissbacteria bacterium]|nr:hypothetical protein [Candidatus Curtissbacteria bacterium]